MTTDSTKQICTVVINDGDANLALGHQLGLFKHHESSSFFLIIFSIIFLLILRNRNEE